MIWWHFLFLHSFEKWFDRRRQILVNVRMASRDVVSRQRVMVISEIPIGDL